MRRSGGERGRCSISKGRRSCHARLMLRILCVVRHRRPPPQVLQPLLLQRRQRWRRRRRMTCPKVGQPAQQGCRARGGGGAAGWLSRQLGSRLPARQRAGVHLIAAIYAYHATHRGAPAMLRTRHARLRQAAKVALPPRRQDVGAGLPARVPPVTHRRRLCCFQQQQVGMLCPLAAREAALPGRRLGALGCCGAVGL